MHNPFLLFDMSGGELFLIVLAIIVLFGPKQIPVIARSIGKVMYEIRTASNQIKQEVMAEARNLEKTVQSPGMSKSPDMNNKPVDNELDHNGSVLDSAGALQQEDARAEQVKPEPNPGISTEKKDS